MGFVWGVCDREFGVVRETNQGGEEGVWRVGGVVLLDGVRQGECHEEVHEGPFCSSMGDPAAWLKERGEARSGADCVLADADVLGGEVVEGEAQAFPDRF